MTLTSSVAVECREARWCQHCGLVVSEGTHHANGDFDQYSVMVSECEIDAAIAQTAKQGNYSYLGVKKKSIRSREHTRYCLALGRHVGAR